MKFVEGQGSVASRRIGSVISDVPDPGGGHAYFLADLGEFQPSRLEIPDSLGPLIHGPEITGSRSECQRHTVTVSRQNHNMSLEKRIKDRLRELDKDAQWLAKRSKIPVSTLYGVMNGSAQGSTRLPAIAAALELHGLWLLDEIGPRLIADTAAAQPPDGVWPFPSINKKRIDDLKEDEIAMIEAAISGLLKLIEDRRGSRGSSKKASR